MACASCNARSIQLDVPSTISSSVHAGLQPEYVVDLPFTDVNRRENERGRRYSTLVVFKRMQRIKTVNIQVVYERIDENRDRTNNMNRGCAEGCSHRGLTGTSGISFCNLLCGDICPLIRGD